MPANRKMPRGFARPLLLIVVLVVVGVGVAVVVGSKNLFGLVLGAKTRSENIYQNKTSGIKVNVISPSSSWDLTEYLCDTREQCQKSATSGKWWATVSGAPTTEDGHEVFIEKSSDWVNYGFLKIAVKEAGVSNNYLKIDGSNERQLILDISTIGTGYNGVEFTSIL